MGEGHNANLLAEHGLQVLGVDFSMVALRKAKNRYPNVQTALVNLPEIHLQPGSLDVILNFWFLDREMFPLYQQYLKPVVTWCWKPCALTRIGINRICGYEYLIQPGELLQAFSGWEFLVYDENVKATAKGKQQLAVRMLARKPVGSIGNRGEELCVKFYNPCRSGLMMEKR